MSHIPIPWAINRAHFFFFGVRLVGRLAIRRPQWELWPTSTGETRGGLSWLEPE